MKSAGTASISELQEDTRAVVRGRVRAASALLTSPLGARPCVYWDVRAGLESDRTSSREGSDFWLEDASGRVLVRADRLVVDARADRVQRVLELAEQNIHEVEARQRAVKQATRGAEGTTKELARERRRLAELATLLYAVRAHARRRVHIGGSLEGQQAWITARSKSSSEATPSAMRLMVDEWEVLLEPGSEVEVEGMCERERIVGAAGAGYRDAATALVLAAPPGGSVIVRGLGLASAAHAPHRSDGGRAHAPRAPERGTTGAGRTGAGGPAPPSRDRLVLAVVTGACTIGALAAWWLTR